MAKAGEKKDEKDEAKPKWVVVDVICASEEPMLCIPMSLAQLAAIGQKTTVKWPTSRPIIEQADEKAKLMMDHEKRYGFPRQWLIGALKKAGTNVETGKAARQKISTATSTRLREFMRIDPICLTLNSDDEPFIPFLTHTPYERDMRKGSSNATAGKSVAVPIVRPKFKVWSFKVRIMVSTNIEIGKIRELFEVAGSLQGLGDFRPGVGGEFGCFAVQSWTKYDDPAVEVPAFELEHTVLEPSTNGNGDVKGKQLVDATA